MMLSSLSFALQYRIGDCDDGSMKNNLSASLINLTTALVYAGGLDQQVQPIANIKSSAVFMICIASLANTSYFISLSLNEMISNPVLLVVVINHLPPSINHHHHFRLDSNNFKVDPRLAASPLSPSSSSSTSPGSLSRTSSLTDMSGDSSASFPFQPAALSQLDQSLPMANNTWDVECNNWSLHLPFFIIVTLYILIY